MMEAWFQKKEGDNKQRREEITEGTKNVWMKKEGIKNKNYKS